MSGVLVGGLCQRYVGREVARVESEKAQADDLKSSMRCARKLSDKENTMIHCEIE